MRRFVVLVATVFGVAVTAKLGLWQAHRASEKRSLQAALDERGSLPPVASQELAAQPASAEAQHYRVARLQGRWLSNHTVFLDNRQMGGRPGFFVVTPLKLSGRPEAVLVQRGWAPRDLVDRTAVPDVASEPGDVIVVGSIAPPPGRLLDFGEPGTGKIRQNLPLVEFAKEAGVTLLPMSILQRDPAASPPEAGKSAQASSGERSPAAGSLLRQWPAPALDVQRHDGYMVQWYGLSALIAGLYLWFQWLGPALSRNRNARRPASLSK